MRLITPLGSSPRSRSNSHTVGGKAPTLPSLSIRSISAWWDIFPASLVGRVKHLLELILTNAELIWERIGTYNRATREGACKLLGNGLPSGAWHPARSCRR